MTLDSPALGNLIQIILLIVTGVGAGLIVKQLRDARLASQMEGLMQLNQQHHEVTDAMFIIDKIIQAQGWEKLSEEEKVAKLEIDEAIQKAWRKIATFYELLGLLVRAESLDKKIAFDFYSLMAITWYRNLEVIIHHRRRIVGPDLFENFEWLAAKFEKMAKKG